MKIGLLFSFLAVAQGYRMGCPCSNNKTCSTVCIACTNCPKDESIKKTLQATAVRLAQHLNGTNRDRSVEMALDLVEYVDDLDVPEDGLFECSGPCVRGTCWHECGPCSRCLASEMCARGLDTLSALARMNRRDRQIQNAGLDLINLCAVPVPLTPAPSSPSPPNPTRPVISAAFSSSLTPVSSLALIALALSCFM